MKVYEIEKILNARKKFSTTEKIDKLIVIKFALLKKLEYLRKGHKITDFTYLQPREY